jgi:hypothetical protein
MCTQAATSESADAVPGMLLEEEYVFDLEEEDLNNFQMGSSVPQGGFQPPIKNVGPSNSNGNNFNPTITPNRGSTPSTPSRTTPVTVGGNFHNQVNGISAFGQNYLNVIDNLAFQPSGLLFFFITIFSSNPSCETLRNKIL